MNLYVIIASNSSANNHLRLYYSEGRDQGEKTYLKINAVLRIIKCLVLTKIIEKQSEQ